MAKAQTSSLECLAARQWHDYQRRTPGTYFGETPGILTLDEAYSVQMEVARLRCAAGDAIAHIRQFAAADWHRNNRPEGRGLPYVVPDHQ